MGNVFAWSFYTKVCDETTIMACRTDDCWEVYYKRTDFPFMFAFGLPTVHTIEEVFSIAEGNIDNYDDMFQ